MQDPSWARPYIRHATALLALKHYSGSEATLKQGIAAVQQGPHQPAVIDELTRALHEIRAAIPQNADARQGAASTSTTGAQQLGPEGALPAAKRARLNGQAVAPLAGKSPVSLCWATH
jgi:hypothetical protein